MNVVYHSSDSFAVVTGVSITSLFENNKSADTINVWLIEHDITQENKNNLIVQHGLRRRQHAVVQQKRLGMSQYNQI